LRVAKDSASNAVFASVVNDSLRKAPLICQTFGHHVKRQIQ